MSDSRDNPLLDLPGDAAETEEEDSDVEDRIEAEEADTHFYWKQTRENLITTAGLRAFQISYAHKDEEYESARAKFEDEYSKLSPRLQKKASQIARHGGYFSTYITLLEEMGLMYREQKGDSVYLRATAAGDQAALLLERVPFALRVVPYFIIELLSRYRFNNPLNKSPKNKLLREGIADSDIFPYWSLYRIMRGCDDTITKDELGRFVFKAKRMAEIPNVVARISAYRRDRQAGMSDEQIDEKYGTPLKGVIAQPKFIMGRAGVQVGVIFQEKDTYTINPDYLPFIDNLLSEEPHFEELDEESWIREYGDPVEATGLEYLAFDSSSSTDPFLSSLKDDNWVYLELTRLIDIDKFSGVMLIGPPGTGKTYYARQIGIKLVKGVRSRLREIQFHPSYQYEDFIEGYIPDGKGGFKPSSGHLLKICSLALQSDDPHVLIIDELSRTDPSRVMGEAMTYMEESLRGQTFYLASSRPVTIPANLIFIATMNPEDRSVDELDAAMDRRWGKIYLAPDADVLNSFLTDNNVPKTMRGAVIDFFRWVQQHYHLGHAFFRTVGDQASLERLWNNQLRFLFEKAFRYDADTLNEIREHWEKMLASITVDPSGTSTS
ncbi:MAG: AAA family ATPase [Acidobacteriota bacterium]